jgi:hypothetical protein
MHRRAYHCQLASYQENTSTNKLCQQLHAKFFSNVINRSKRQWLTLFLHKVSHKWTKHHTPELKSYSLQTKRHQMIWGGAYPNRRWFPGMAVDWGHGRDQHGQQCRLDAVVPPRTFARRPRRTTAAAIADRIPSLFCFPRVEPNWIDGRRNYMDEMREGLRGKLLLRKGHLMCHPRRSPRLGSNQVKRTISW